MRADRESRGALTWCVIASLVLHAGALAALPGPAARLRAGLRRIDALFAGMSLRGEPPRGVCSSSTRPVSIEAKSALPTIGGQPDEVFEVAPPPPTSSVRPEAVWTRERRETWAAHKGVQTPREPDLLDYVREVRAAIAKEVFVPNEVPRYGLSARVVLDVHLDASGDLSEVAFIKKSRYPSVNRAAIEAVRAAAPFPCYDGQERGPLRLKVPIVYGAD